MSFVGLHNHTEFSNVKLRDCIIKIPDLVKRAIEYGYKGVAITDHEVLSGHVQALRLQDKLKEEHPDFKIILGNEIYLIDESEYQNARKYYHFILLAKDKTGYDQLRALSSRAWARSYNEKGMLRTPTFYQDFAEVIGEDKGHLIACTACLGGRLATAIIEKDQDALNDFVSWCVNTFGQGNFYFEMQDSDSDDQKIVNETILRMSEFFDIPYIITSDAHYLDKQDISVHHAFLNSKEEKERETESFYKYTYLKREKEIKEILSYLPTMAVQVGIDNTMLVYDAIESFDFRHSVIIPQIKITTPKEEYAKYSIHMEEAKAEFPYICKFADSEYEQDNYLLYQIDQGLQIKGPVKASARHEYFDRINTELEVLWNISEYNHQRMSAYINLVQRITELAWKVSLLGVARGSSGGFLINYLVGITQINPLEYGLPYWRFLNNERLDDFPDIDIDVDPTKTGAILELLREEFGQDNVLNTVTFKTESLKSAILTAARGLGLNNDDAQALSSMVPIERGKVASLDFCLHGNDEEPPVAGFKEFCDRYDGLLETISKIEGLVSGRGIHASSVYILNDGYLAHNSLMRAPNKTPITAFDMHDSDSLGCLKFDLLRTDAQSKLAKALELLLRDGLIQWQGSLKATYDEYLHPDKIDFSDKRLWDNINHGRIMNLFQFETQVGAVGILRVKPTSVLEMSLTNDAMRLQGTLNGLSPIERFAQFKKDPTLWLKEMNGLGITPEEQEILQKHLASTYGNSINQETLMQLLMDERIAGFSLREANAARKILAKKLLSQVEGLKAQFYEHGKGRARKEFLDYVLFYFIEPQLGYSFSSIHSHGYSIIGVQEAWLYTKYNPLYWSCACLSINAGSVNTDFDSFDSFGDEEEEVVDEDEAANDTEGRVTATNYGKVAKAIGDIQKRGIKVLLPDINRAQSDFVPDIENNAILYGLRAVVGVNDDIINTIIANRPYTGLKDFMNRVELTNIQYLSLVKAGAFDAIEKRHRLAIMEEYLDTYARRRVFPKQKLTIANLTKLIELNALPDEFELQKKVYYFKKWVDEHCIKTDAAGKKYYSLEEQDEINFFANYLKKHLTAAKDYDNINTAFAVKSAAMKRAYEKEMTPLKEWMACPESISYFYEAEVKAQVNEWKEKYCQGGLSRWEMDSLGCYAESPHELARVDRERYNIHSFDSLPETPVVTAYKKNKAGVSVPLYQLSRIAGTVLNADKQKHIVSILTPEGVVDIKLYQMTFVHYNKRISNIDSKGKKVVVEKSWFTRGNQLLITGFRRDTMFVPKRDFERGFSYCVQLITDVRSGGELVLKNQREKGED